MFNKVALIDCLNRLLETLNNTMSTKEEELLKYKVVDKLINFIDEDN